MSATCRDSQKCIPWFVEDLNSLNANAKHREPCFMLSTCERLQGLSGRRTRLWQPERVRAQRAERPRQGGCEGPFLSFSRCPLSLRGGRGGSRNGLRVSRPTRKGTWRIVGVHSLWRLSEKPSWRVAGRRGTVRGRRLPNPHPHPREEKPRPEDSLIVQGHIL